MNLIRISFIAIILLQIQVIAQVPQGIPYQAAARNSNGQPLSNRAIQVRFSIIDSTATGVEVYKETNNTITNALGLFTLTVGTGNAVVGTFSTINWGHNFKFLKVELDTTTSGSSFVDLGTQQMMSVPFALYSNNGLTAGTIPGQMNYWDGTAWVNIAPGLNNQILTFCNGVPTWGPCAPIVINLPSVTICNQEWTTKNLDVLTYRNGDVIPQVTSPSQWASISTGAWCWYNNDSATYSATYGKIYNWYAIADPRGLAPFGWHIPSDSEWNSMVKCLDPAADTTCTYCFQTSVAGGMLKEVGTSHWLSPNTGATNTTGYLGLPGGSRFDNGTFSGIGTTGYCWTSTDYSVNYAWNHSLFSSNSAVGKYGVSKQVGYSVRCVKD